jgi:enoyl-CoA hydratase
MTKRTLWANLEIPGMQAAIDLENRNQLLLGLTNNLSEFITARKEKREPVYEDIPRIFD